MGKPKKSQTTKVISRLSVSLRHLGNKFASAVFPTALACINCKDEIPDSHRYHSICEKCLHDLPYITHKQCKCCGEFLYDGVYCNQCLIDTPYFDKVISPFSYDKIIKKIIVSYKDGGNSYLYRYIAQHLLDFYRASEVYHDIVTYVPSDIKAIRRRGFEHNKKVCQMFAKGANLTMLSALVRTKSTIDQTKSTRDERIKNVKDAFVFNNQIDSLKLANKDILLIDDILTTGATANECAKVLKAKGCASVTVLTLARR